MKLLILLMPLYLWFSRASMHADDPEKSITKTGVASYYASFFNGRKTSSGEVYKHQKFTAAHMSLPFGTKVTVTNVNNGKSVEVRINDRGPHSKRIMIDLSQAAAKEIGLYGKGVGRVTLTYEKP
jgi:rare lipoprotein A